MKILYVTTISITMNSFFKPHIKMLVDEGNKVDIACNLSELALDPLYDDLGCDSFHIDFSRAPLSLSNFKAFKQLREVIKNGNYDVVHCHTPNASVITRLVCRKFRKKNGLKVFYTAHGFHFYKGAPRLNWMVYYPVERFCSRFTDKLITINKEDYELAKTKFMAKEVCYVPGVGINLSRFQNIEVDRAAKRREIGVPVDAIMITSVGELIRRKNHGIVVRALGQINNINVHYAIVGSGDLLSELRALSFEYNISDRVHFLGYRNDVSQIYTVSDICCLPSTHEGLPVSLMEGMACGLPCAVSRIRGNTDLINDNGGVYFDPNDVSECTSALLTLINTDNSVMGVYNQQKIKEFSIETVLEIMKTIYE